MKEWSLAAHRLELRVGDQHIINLEGLGSAGYVWIFRIEGNSSIVSITKQAAVAPSLQTPEAYSTQESFRVIAESPGQVVVKFVQRHPWESDDIPPRAEKVFEILVKISSHSSPNH